MINPIEPIANTINTMVNTISNVTSKNINIPTVNIESFGIDKNYPGNNNPKYYFKYYIASLNFEVKTLFRNYTKTVYLPILFRDEKPIKDLLAHYNNIYFEVKVDRNGWYIEKSDIYHISEIVNLDKIYNKLYKNYKDVYSSDPDEFYVNFYIDNYNGYHIGVCQHIKDRYNLTIADIYNFVTDSEINLIEYIKDDYTKYENIALFDYFYITNPNTSYHNEDLELVMKEIDRLNNEDRKKNEALNAMYSKKSFKLVEN